MTQEQAAASFTIRLGEEGASAAVEEQIWLEVVEHTSERMVVTTSAFDVDLTLVWQESADSLSYTITRLDTGDFIVLEGAADDSWELTINIGGIVTTHTSTASLESMDWSSGTHVLLAIMLQTTQTVEGMFHGEVAYGFCAGLCIGAIAVGGLITAACWRSEYKCETGECISDSCWDCAPSWTCSNDCSTDADCRHLECRGGACVTFNSPGTDLCTVAEDCRHTECSNGSCETKNTPGIYECIQDTECVHNTCEDGACVSANGAGSDECQNAEDCQHTACNSEGLCEVINSPGSDTCQSHADCRHKACVDDACTTVTSPGTDTCETDDDCTGSGTGGSGTGGSGTGGSGTGGSGTGGSGTGGSGTGGSGTGGSGS